MKADVCLILEGTYPYVQGGVSSWVKQLLDAMPYIRFNILYLGPKRNDFKKLKYHLPANVINMHEAYIHDYPDKKPHLKVDKLLSQNQWQKLEQLQEDILEAKPLDLHTLQTLVNIPKTESQFMDCFAYSQQAWEIAKNFYHKHLNQEAGFLDFYWAYRFVNLPLLKLLRIKIPRARIYHAACTGYAGMLGAIASKQNDAAFLISEHGIYTRERRIEIFNSSWIKDDLSKARSLDMGRKRNFYKYWWVQFFLSLSRSAYNAADQIYSLFDANKIDQIADGAPDSIKIIPNGVNVFEFTKLKQRYRHTDDIFHIGFIGRVASIKDIKTLLRTLDILNSENLNFKLFIMGPQDEEAEYVQECQEFIEVLDLKNKIEFTGMVDVKKYLPILDVVVLSSISEGLPFVILEANAAGVPVVATDVGACRELLEGRSAEDKEIGPSGFVVPVASPSPFAEKLKILYYNPEYAREIGKAGRKRVQTYYALHLVTDAYKKEYEYFLMATLQD